MLTSNKAFDARNYSFVQDQPILIDANILIYLYPPPSSSTQHWASATYSRVFQQLLVAKSKPLVDCLVLSEYFNRYLRVEYDANWKSIYKNFKNFRQSADASSTLANSIGEIQQIVSVCQLTDTQLNTIQFDDVLTTAAAGGQDFNDLVLLENCRMNGWSLLTNDSDMCLGGVNVLTANNRLLAACP